MTQGIAKTYTMAELAKALDGRLTGDGDLSVTRLIHPSQESAATDLALAMDPKILPLLVNGTAVLAILAEGMEAPPSLKACIFARRPRLAIATLTALFDNRVAVPRGVHPTAIIEDGAVIEENVAIGALAYIGAGAIIGRGATIHPQVYIGPNAAIGEDSLIYAGARIGESVKIGARAIIHFNASLGADGFSFVTPEIGSVETAKATGNVGAAQNLQLIRIASLGAVELGNDVEIGANTSVDRGTIVATRIGNGTKLDNQVQIGHNVTIGENCMLCGRVAVAGSCTLGDRVVLGGAVGVADHVTIGSDVVVMGMSGVAGDVPPQSLVGGLPAKPRKKFMEDMKNIGRIKYMSEKIKVLFERVEALEKK